jgi:hypothetical protein
MLENKQNYTTQKRIDLLNDLGFTWNPKQVAWDTQLNSFKSFREQYGHSNVPPNDTKYRSLYGWMRDQRRQYALAKQGKKSNIETARVKVLDRISFCWDPLETRWSFQFQELREFMDEHGHCVIPAENISLQRWANNQRREYKKFTDCKGCGITEERIRALQSIGFDWNPSNE